MQRGRTPYGTKQQQLGNFGFAIVFIIIIIYLLYQFFSKSSYYPFSSSLATTSPINYSSTYQTSNLDSYNYPNQSSSNMYDPYSYNSYNSYSAYDYSTQNSLPTSEKNYTLTGYWVLFDMNGVITQFNLNSNDYAFVQRLIQNDTKGIPKIKIFLIENGRTRQYIVSTELYTIIANMNYIIDSRTINSSTTSPSYGSSYTTPNSYSNSSTPNSSAIPNSSTSNSYPNTSTPNSTYNQGIKP
ncbi:hypothetical protein Desdi_1105 [Desulfitobacterium dichloroeliminans LMG P-21439]|uniref:Uncharacterized protein n=1 Tax=Desulfitobacterium dichloroeliminans (strain LMG P-21439 / DCA1) TaxID=871963 RepID=L0F6H3_DESDL|nr:hypothetical protein [Desulfitobacterium dichloroeliminans]AGA68620.1 hypothetical protein Desdi_1105 [Desulfitobacterium dichloroeliminans LMG P-21439]